MNILRTTLLSISGLLSLGWLVAMAFAGGPQSIGEGLLVAWAFTSFAAAALTLFTGRRPRAETLGPVGERTP